MNCPKIIANAALIVALGAAMFVTSAESSPDAPGEAYAVEECNNPTAEEKPRTSEISACIEPPEGTSDSETLEPEARYPLTIEERTAIERMVASEGGYCDYEFQALVALCILNGCEADNLRPSELFARGDFWLTHDVEPTETTKQAVSDVFDRGIFPTDEPVRYYYNPNYCQSPVHEQKSYVLTNTGCRFFKD